jgi:hypothetical protein
MNPKRDAEGFAIDYYSNTVEDAAAFQAHYNGHLLAEEKDYHYYEEDVDEEDDEDYDRCGCSDPCCPCDGFKVGTP